MNRLHHWAIWVKIGVPALVVALVVLLLASPYSPLSQGPSRAEPEVALERVGLRTAGVVGGPISVNDQPRSCADVDALISTREGWDVGTSELRFNVAAPDSADLAVADMRVVATPNTEPLDTARVSCHRPARTGWPVPGPVDSPPFSPTDISVTIGDTPEVLVTEPVVLLAGDARSVPVHVLGTAGYQSWKVEVDLVVGSSIRTVVLDDGGRPFRTAGAPPGGTDTQARDQAALKTAELTGLERVWTDPPTDPRSPDVADGIAIDARLGANHATDSAATPDGYQLLERTWSRYTSSSGPPTQPPSEDCQRTYGALGGDDLIGTGSQSLILSLANSVPDDGSKPRTVRLLSASVRLVERRDSDRRAMTFLRCMDTSAHAVEDQLATRGLADVGVNDLPVGASIPVNFTAVYSGPTYPALPTIITSDHFALEIRTAGPASAASPPVVYGFVLDTVIDVDGRVSTVTVDDGGRPFRVVDRNDASAGRSGYIACAGAPEWGWVAAASAPACPSVTSETPPP